MSPPELQARLDGQLCAVRKQPPSANPHPLGTSVSRAWSKGYREVSAVSERGAAL